MVKVSRTTAKAWAQSNSGVPGAKIKSRFALAVTGVVPAKFVVMRLSRGPARIRLGIKVRRMPGSVTDGSCFQIKKRDPTTSGIGTGIGVGTGEGSGAAGLEDLRECSAKCS